MTARPGRHVIVAIGVDRYQHWRRLDNAVSDAEGATALFKQLGFEEVVPPLLNEQATGAAMRVLVSDVLARCLHRDDSLVLFFAGHGGTRTQPCGEQDVRTGYLIPVDGLEEGDRFMSWIELEPWLKRVSRLPPKHIVVILDACETGIALSGVMHTTRSSSSLVNQPFGAANQKMSRLLITSAAEGEVAMDSGPRSGHSLFTGCLIDALTGGDVRSHDHDGRPITIGSELGNYVRYRVQSYSGSSGGVQTPNVGRFERDRQGEMLIPLLVESAARLDTRAPSAGESAALRPSESSLQAARPLTHSTMTLRWRSPALRRARPILAMIVSIVLAGFAYRESCGLTDDNRWAPNALLQTDAAVDAAPPIDAAVAAPPSEATMPGAEVAAVPHALMAPATPKPSAQREAICPTEIRSYRGVQVTWRGVTRDVPAVLRLPCGFQVPLTLHSKVHVAQVKNHVASPSQPWVMFTLRRKR